MNKNKRGEFYFLNDKKYISVTEVLKIIDKPALRYWFGNEVYKAMQENPSLSREEALASPYKVSSDARQRGSTVHSIIEAYKHTKEYIKTVPTPFVGFTEAFYKWIEDYKGEILENEKIVVSEIYQYAGTLDLLVRINGCITLIDVKTGKDIYQEAWLQGAAYREALKEQGTDCGAVGILLLNENGYKFETLLNTEKYFEAFLSAKRLYELLKN